MRLYHRTTRARAEAIVSAGFVDTAGWYGLVDESTGERVRQCGVWLSDVPVDAHEGAEGDTVLRVSLALTDHELAMYELVEAPNAKGYREWCIPAALVNTRMAVDVLEPEAEELAGAARFK
jgi:hypothetical protein